MATTLKMTNTAYPMPTKVTKDIAQPPVGVGNLGKNIYANTPFEMQQSRVGMEGGYPTPASFELPMNEQGQFTNLLQKPSFDIVTPWKALAQGDVQKGYQGTLAKNAAMQGTAATQASEGLAMGGGVSARQTARLADRALQNKLLNDQLAEQQRQANELKVNLGGENMAKQQEGFLAETGLKTDLNNQQYSMGNIGNMNDYIAKLVEEALKRQQGKDMGAAL